MYLAYKYIRMAYSVNQDTDVTQCTGTFVPWFTEYVTVCHNLLYICLCHDSLNKENLIFSSVSCFLISL